MEFIEAMKAIGVDTAGTLYRFGGNQDLWKRFVKKFAHEATYKALEKAVKENEHRDIENQAHTLKGVAANLGFSRLSEVCNDLVWDVRNQACEQVEPDFHKVREEYQIVIHGIGQLD